MSAFTDQVIKHARAELARWNNGQGREVDQPYRSYVGEYWKVGLKNPNVDGATTYQTSKGKAYRPAWSSAFISYIYRKAGAGSDFVYNAGHIHYIVQAMRDAAFGSSTAKFLGRDPTSYAPKPGDLINEGRDYAKSVTHLTVLDRYGTKPVPDGAFLPTHSDIVVAVDLPKRRLVTVGGNVATDTVGAKTWTLNSDGTLKKGAGMICVVDCRL